MAVKKRIPNITIVGARLMYRNFGGKPDKFNPNGGVRQFCVMLDDPQLAQKMIDDGWNVRVLASREEGEEPQPYIQVAVSYKIRPPRVVLISGMGTPRVSRVTLTEDLLDMADFVNVANADLTINPSQWEMNGNSGVKAYLQSIFITAEVDELEQKYADIPELEFNAAPLGIEGPQDPNMIDGEIVEDDEDEYLQIGR